MSELETRMDDCVALGFQAEPAYSTTINTLDNGREQRNQNWTRARRSFEAEHRNFPIADAALLLALFHAVAGMAHSFRFKDWTDYSVVGGALGLTPGANQTPVQLVKVYTAGALTRTRTIQKPVAGTVTVYENGVAKAGTIDTATGLFTPTTNWTAGATLTADFEFDVPVRFASDALPCTIDARQDVVTVNSSLVEVFL